MAGELIVNAYPHPLRQTPVQAVAPQGMTLEEIVGDAHERVHVVLDGEYIPRDRWAMIEPRADQVIEVRATPAGGDDTWRLIGTILVAAAAFYVPGAFGFAAGSWQAAAISTTVSLAGSLALNALLPPAVPNNDDVSGTQRKSITGVRNQLAPYGLIPRPYGRMKLYPVVVGKPVTEVIGNDQYIRMLFAVGVGDLKLSELKIGDSLVSNYSDVEINVGSTEVDQNYGGIVSSDSPIDLYNRDVNETALSDQLTSESGPNIITRTTAVDCVEFGIDLTMPLGLVVHEQGNTWALGVMLLIEYSPTGAGTWSNVADLPGVRLSSDNIRLFSTPTGNQFFVSGMTHDTLRAGLSIAVSQGQYDIRITPSGPYTHQYHPIPNPYAHNWSRSLSDVDDFDDLNEGVWDDPGWSSHGVDIVWTALRTWQPSAPVSQDVLDNAVLVGMRIRATEQLNGVVDQFNLLSQTKLAAWDGAAWTAAAITRNPAWAYVDALTGIANPRPVSLSRINTTEIKAWADWCDANGFYYDSSGDTEQTVFETIREITAAGRATWAIRDGLYTVVRDTESQTPVQMFTPRNSWGFSAVKSFPQIPHALKVRFKNPAANYADDEMLVYADGYSADGAGATEVATEFEELVLPGVTDPDQAWKLGRYHLAQLILRPETYTLHTDLENLACSRGSLVRCAHDVTLWGSGWGRVKSITTDVNGDVTSLVSDEVMTMDGSSTYVVRVRRADGTQVVQQVTTVTGNTTTLDFTSPVSGVGVGDLFLMGLQDQESVDLKITRIDPGADLSARLTLVDAAPAIHQADQGTIPEFVTGITEPLELAQIRPPAPTIANIRSDETVLLRDIDGSLRVRVVVAYRFGVQVGLPGLQIEMRLRRTNGHDAWRTVGPRAVDGQIDAADVEELAEYEIQLRAVNGALVSDWSASQLHTIIGKTSDPSDVTGAVYAIEDAGIRITWQEVGDRDVVGYRLRVGDVFDAATIITTVDASGHLWAGQSAGTHTVWITAYDGVRESANPARLDVIINAPPAVSPNWTFAGDLIVFSWTEPASDFPITLYAIKQGADWDSGTPVAEIKSTEFTLRVDWSGSQTFWIGAIDALGNESAAAELDVTVNAAQQPSVSNTFAGEFVLLEWSEPTSDLPIEEYRIRQGNDWASATPVAAIKGTSHKVRVTWSGSQRYLVAAVNSAGVVGVAGAIDVVIDAPDVTGLSQQVIDNYAVLRWSFVAGTLPIAGARIYEGATFGAAVERGEVTGTIETIYESQMGTYTYWIEPFDSAGNAGTAMSISAFVNEPPDYVLNVEWVDDLTGTKSNAYLTADGNLLLPVNTTETWDDHYTNNGWTSPQDQIDAGYDYYAMPSANSASYEQEFDYGTVLSATKITLTDTITTLAGSVTITPTISVRKLGTDPWIDYVDAREIYATDFQYVKLRYDAIAADGDDLVTISQATLRLDSKLRNDAGKATSYAADANGTLVSFNRTFVDIASIVVTPLGTDKVKWIVNFTDAPNPTDFRVLIWDDNGNRIDRNFTWTARGY